MSASFGGGHWSIAVALGLALLAGPPGTRAADLATLYALAEQNDPVFQSARHELEAARQKRPEAFSTLLPSVVATASLSRTFGKTQYTDTPEINRTYNADQWLLQLTQPIFRIDTVLAYDEARASVEQALAQYASASQDLILRFSRAYFDELVAENQVTAVRAQLRALDEQLTAARRSFEAGVGSITDVDDTRARAAAAQAQQVAAMNDLQASQAALEAIVGEPAPALDPLKAGAVLPRPDPEEVATWVTRATEDHPSVKAAKAGLQGAEHEVQRMLSQHLPSIDLVAGYGANYSAGNITQPMNYATNVHDKQISLQLSVPLLDGGGIQARVAEARAKRAKAASDVTAAQRQAALDARTAYGAILSGVAQTEALQTAVAAGESALKGNRIGYGLGIRINSDVLNAQQQLYGAMRDLEKARYDTLFQGLKLKAAAGELSEQDLKAVNALLRPAEPGPDAMTGQILPAEPRQ
jgi:outer membrane protein